MAIDIFGAQSPTAMASEVYGTGGNMSMIPQVDMGLPPSIGGFSQARNAAFDQMVAGAKPGVDMNKALAAIMGAMKTQPYSYAPGPQAPSGGVKLGDAPKAKNFAQMPAAPKVSLPSLAQLLMAGK
jgi:hypothetical protein